MAITKFSTVLVGTLLSCAIAATITPSTTETPTPSPSSTPIYPHCNAACADSVCTVLNGGPETCLGACAPGFIQAAAPARGCQMSHTLGFVVILQAPGDCTALLANNVTVNNVTTFLGAISGAIGVPRTQLYVSDFNCFDLSSGGNFSQVVATVNAINMNEITTRAAQVQIPSLSVRLPAVLVKTTLLTVTGTTIGAVTSMCDPTCRTCADVGSTQCTSCGSGFVLGGDLSLGTNGPTTCIPVALSRYPPVLNNNSATINRNLLIAIICAAGAALLLIACLVGMCIRRRRRASKALEAAEAAKKAEAQAQAKQAKDEADKLAAEQAAAAQAEKDKAAAAVATAKTSLVSQAVETQQTASRAVTLSQAPNGSNVLTVALPDWMSSTAAQAEDSPLRGSTVRTNVDIVIDYGSKNGTVSLRPSSPSRSMSPHRSSNVFESQSAMQEYSEVVNVPSSRSPRLLQQQQQRYQPQVSVRAFTEQDSMISSSDGDDNDEDAEWDRIVQGVALPPRQYRASSPSGRTSPSKQLDKRYSTSDQGYAPQYQEYAPQYPVRAVYADTPRKSPRPVDEDRDVAYSVASDWEAWERRSELDIDLERDGGGSRRELDYNPEASLLRASPTVSSHGRPSQRTSRTEYLADLSDRMYEIAEKLPVRYESSGHSAQFLARADFAASPRPGAHALKVQSDRDASDVVWDLTSEDVRPTAMAVQRTVRKKRTKPRRMSNKSSLYKA